MPAEPADQGTQVATENASTPSTPPSYAEATDGKQATKDKQTTTEQSEQGRVESKSDPLMDALGIPADVQAQITRHEEGAGQEESPATESGESPELPPETTPEAKETKPKIEDEDDDEDEPPAAEGKDNLEDKSPDELKKIAAKRQKRINRLTRQKGELEDKLDSSASEAEKLRGELEKGQERPGSPIPATGEWFPDEETAETHRTLSAELNKADAVIQWCNEHSDGATTVEGDNQTWVTPQEVAQWKSRAEGDRLRVSPEIAMIEREAKQAYRATQVRFDNLAKEAWPQLFDKSTKEYQLSRAILKQFPGVKASPEVNYALGLVIEGMRAVQMRTKPNGNGTEGNATRASRLHRDISERAFEPRVPIAPHTPEPPSRAVTPSSTKRYNEAMTKLKNDPDGSAESLAAVFAAEDEMSSTRAGSKTPVKI